MVGQQTRATQGVSALIGQPAPGFCLPNTHGELVDLADHRGRPAIIFFFPFAFTAVCTGELRALADLQRSVPAVDLWAISADTRYALRVFAETEGLPFSLLSDFWPHGDTAQAYGAFDAERGCAERASFLLDAEHTVVWSDRSDLAHPRDLAAQLAALETIG